MTTTERPETRAVPGFDPIPSRRRGDAVQVDVVTDPPADATVVGIPDLPDGAVPERVPLDRATLEASGFGGRAGADPRPATGRRADDHRDGSRPAGDGRHGGGP